MNTKNLIDQHEIAVQILEAIASMSASAKHASEHLDTMEYLKFDTSKAFHELDIKQRSVLRLQDRYINHITKNLNIKSNE